MIEFDSKSVIHILKECLNYVDPRLIDHGSRVAFLVRGLLQFQGTYDSATRDRIMLAALLHDIGAYKTDEIDRMFQFETGDVWKHAVYGYLFIRHLSPLSAFAPAILFHHADYRQIRELELPYLDIAQLLCLADRVDIYLNTRHEEPPDGYLERWEGRKFAPDIIEIFNGANRGHALTGMILDGTCQAEMERRFEDIPFTSEEIDQFLHMLVYAIDFRSYFTVVHTMMTMSISVALARASGLPPYEIEKIKYGSLLHDLGKIAIPVEILEYPGKLTPSAMEIMKTHVTITEKILAGCLPDEVVQIAVRHHEKLDGSGYPRGLAGDLLTKSQRIVAVADILSALSGTRSYKASFDKERVVRILRDMSGEGLLCPETVATALDNYDSIMAHAQESSEPVLAIYYGIQDDYERLYHQCRDVWS